VAGAKTTGHDAPHSKEQRGLGKVSELTTKIVGLLWQLTPTPDYGELH